DGLALTGVLLKRQGGPWLRLDSVEVVDGKIVGRRGGVHYSGADLVGSRWQLSPVQGPAVEVWISAYSVISATQTRYTFKTGAAGGLSTYVCDPDLLGDHSAIPIADLTVDHQTGDMAAREGTMFLACLSGAV